jgi:signal transduction histidine kinase
MIVVAVPPPALELALAGVDLGKDSLISLERSDGIVLARTRDAGADGIERVMTHSKLEGYPLIVSVGQSVDAVFELYRQQRIAMVAAGIVATVLLLALALVGGSRLRDRARYFARQERLMLDLHDGCIQAIYAIGLQLQSCRRFVAKDPARAERAIAEAGARLNLVIQELRAFIAGTTRATYSEEEFMAEIERMFPATGEVEPVFSVEVDRSAVRSLPPGQAEQVLRIAREAVSNVLRHAKARTARVSFAKREGKFSLQVADDGVGLASSSASTLGLGLDHIDARARKLGGAARIAAAPGGGTQVSVEWPQQP